MIEWIQHWDEMRFYYWSGLNWIMLLPVYVGGVLLVGLLWWLLVKVWKKAWIVVIAMLPVLAIVPWSEEMSIAWNFGQLCKKDAGVFIYKTVEVEGFYDDTTGWGPRQLAQTNYKFVESKDVLHKKLSRVERASSASRDRALAWYAGSNRGKERPKDLFIVQNITDSEQIVVSPVGVDAWRITQLTRPTAQYHYRTSASHEPVSNQVKKFEDVVVDTQTGEVLGRYLNYYRGAPWFFIGLDRPTIACSELKGKPRIIYPEVLVAATAAD